MAGLRHTICPSCSLAQKHLPPKGATLADYITTDADGAEVDLVTLPDAAVETRLRRTYPTATAITIADGVATLHLPDPVAERYADLAGNRLAQGRASLVMVKTLRRLPTLADMTLLLAAAETELRVAEGVDWRSSDRSTPWPACPDATPGYNCWRWRMCWRKRWMRRATWCPPWGGRMRRRWLWARGEAAGRCIRH